MRLILFSLATIASFSVFAVQPAAETKALVKALLNSPNVVNQLQVNHIDTLNVMTVTAISDGITQYDLVFNRSCECLPATATVKIVEDLTPTWRDGLPKYDSKVDISKGN
jgi:hypothetical protein